MRTKIIILSIHPQHIDKILSGKKLYEYRKRVPDNIQYIVVYATSPVKKIVALIKVDTIIRGTPAKVWTETYRYSGITKAFFMDYFSQSKEARAIRFDTVYKLFVPRDVTDLKNIVCAPQAYTYVNESVVELCRKLNVHLDKR